MSDDREWLYEMNQSELAYLASSLNENAHRDIPKDILIDILEGVDHQLPPRRVDDYRNALFAYVDAHWLQCLPLLSCPIKSRQPRSCFGCPDIQVAECVLKNHKNPITQYLTTNEEEIEEK